MKYKRNHTKNLLHLACASVNTDLFRNLYVTDENGNEIDAMNDGDVACAYFVTGLLRLVGRIDMPHATVATTVKIFENSDDWQKVVVPLPGDVVQWGEGPNGHSHIGFVVDEQKVVSNSSELCRPTIHSFDMEDGRKPVCFWRFIGREDK